MGEGKGMMTFTSHTLGATSLPDRVWIVHHGLVGSLTVAQLELILKQIRPQHSLCNRRRERYVHVAGDVHSPKECSRQYEANGLGLIVTLRNYRSGNQPL